MQEPRRQSSLDTQGYITLSYLGAVIVGMIFDYNYYSNFGVNIFEYADILDFLLAPVKNLEMLVFVMITFILVSGFFWLDRRWAKKYPKSYRKFNFGLQSKPYFNKYRTGVFLVSLFLYLILTASIYSPIQLKRFEKSNELIEVIYDSNTEEKSIGKLIGKNSDYIFLQETNGTVKAIPIHADVREIIIPPQKGH